MHFQGRELISRGTKTTSRAVLTVSLTIILSSISDVDLQGLTIFEVELGEANLTIIGSALAVFLLVSHLVSWLGDLLSFQRWNISEKVSTEARTDETGSKSLISKLESALSQITHLMPPDAEVLTVGQHSQFNTLVAATKNIESELNELRAGLKGFTIYANIVLWGWYLLLPTGLTVWAFYVLHSNDFLSTQ